MKQSRIFSYLFFLKILLWSIKNSNASSKQLRKEFCNIGLQLLALSKAVGRTNARRVVLYFGCCADAAAFVAKASRHCRHLPIAPPNGRIDVEAGEQQQQRRRVKFFCMTGKTSAEERAAIWRDFKTFDGVSVLANVQVLQEGVDCESLDLLGLMYNKQSEVSLTQMFGRVVRLPPRDAPIVQRAGHVFFPHVTRRETVSDTLQVDETYYRRMIDVAQRLFGTTHLHVVARGCNKTAHSFSLDKRRVESSSPSDHSDLLESYTLRMIADADAVDAVAKLVSRALRIKRVVLPIDHNQLAEWKRQFELNKIQPDVKAYVGQVRQQLKQGVLSSEDEQACNAAHLYAPFFRDNESRPYNIETIMYYVNVLCAGTGPISIEQWLSTHPQHPWCKRVRALYDNTRFAIRKQSRPLAQDFLALNNWSVVLDDWTAGQSNNKNNNRD